MLLAPQLENQSGSVLRHRDPDLELSKGCAVMSPPTPIQGDPAGLKEEACLWGSADPHLLGTDSGPLHGELPEAHCQAR